MTPKQWARFWAQIQWGSELKIWEHYNNSLWSPILWLCPQPNLKLGSPVDKKVDSQLSFKFSLSYTQLKAFFSKCYTLPSVTQGRSLASTLFSSLPYFLNHLSPCGHLLSCHSHPSLPLWSSITTTTLILYIERKDK